jgi:para-nitrobenzyl esterase
MALLVAATIAHGPPGFVEEASARVERLQQSSSRAVATALAALQVRALPQLRGSSRRSIASFSIHRSHRLGTLREDFMVRLTRIAARTAALSLTVAISALAGAASAQTLVTTADGDVQGQVNDGTREFLGIPFAAPPVGDFRFAPPQPVTPWVAPLDATTYPPACAQLPVLTNGNVRIENEDCLYLNVWTPETAPTEPLPVMVWIHGGSNTSGSTGDFVPFPGYEGQRLYDGHVLTRNKNVVIVSVNYRLNVFGFLGLDELAAEDPSWPYAGNQGLLDQRKALEWVQANISAFGGDPGNVTIFGESAGSFDVCAHVASPGSEGLFHRAISQSGGCTVGVLSSDEASALADSVAEIVGCDLAPDRLACLRAVPLADLLDAGPLVELAGETLNLALSVDGGFLPVHPRVAFEEGGLPRVPYILGANSDEGTLFFIGSPEITEAEYTNELIAAFGAFAPQVEALYPASEFDTPRDALIRVVGDSRLVCSTYDTAKRYGSRSPLGGRKRQRTWVYNFARVPPIGFIDFLELGAFHGLEISYVFGSVLPPPTVFDSNIGARIQEYWTSFAKFGRPKPKKDDRWPRFNGNNWRIMRFDTSFNVTKTFRRAECEFWSTVYDAQL